jgi:prefoldin subunit 5
MHRQLGVVALLVLLTCASGQPSITTTDGNLTIAVDTGKDVVMSVGAQTVLVSALVGLSDTVASLVASQQATSQQVTSMQATILQLQADLQQERAWREGNATTLSTQISVGVCDHRYRFADSPLTLRLALRLQGVQTVTSQLSASMDSVNASVSEMASLPGTRERERDSETERERQMDRDRE